MISYDIVSWYDMTYDIVQYSIVSYMIWYDMIWHRFVIWYGMIWYRIVWYRIIYDMIWYDTIWYDVWYDMISYHMGTRCPGYELSCVRVVVGTSCPGYELSWVWVVLGTSCLGYELSWVRVVLGTSCLGYELSWVRVVQIPTVGPYILWTISPIWLMTFIRNAFDDPEISADLVVYICDVTFEIRARAERQVIETRGNSRLNKGQTFIKQAIPSKNIPTCWSTAIS